MIKVKDLKCEYVNGNSNQILFENVNFEIKDGDFVIITGPSGSGKTSLLKILSGHQKPNNGEVYWDEQNIYNLKEKIFSKLKVKDTGFIYQDFMLIDELNVYDNIILPQHFINAVNKEYINKIINDLELNDLLYKYPTNLSGGQRQRVSIARSLVNNPKVIFCDEPTGSLDYVATKKIMDLLKYINDEYSVTIILVTHEQENLKYGKSFIKFINGTVKCE